MSPAAPQTGLPGPSWWEEHVFPRLEALMQRAVQDLGALVAGSQPASGTGASGVALSGPRFVITLPSDPLALARLATDSGIAGISIPLILRQVLTVPANGTGQITIPVAQGVYFVLGDHLRGYSTVHDPAITASILVDNVNPLMASNAVTADIDLMLTSYNVLRSELTATIVNGTANPVTVTLDAPTIIVASTEYDTFWRPFFHYAYTTTRAVALAATQGGGTG